MNTQQKLPLRVWILTLAAFAIGTAEFVIAGLLPQVAEDLRITEGQAGNLITAYALAIVIGGPLLTLWLARFDKQRVLVGLMGLFIVGNLIAGFTDNYALLLLSRVLAGLTQGPFYGIGAVVATRLVSDSMAGRAIGQMFAGLTLANVLGVPAGAWIGNRLGWNTTFIVVAALGAIALAVIARYIPHLADDRKPGSIASQLAAFRSRGLLTGLAITVLGWTGFMAFYGYVAPVAEQVAGFSRPEVAWILVVVGSGLVVGNHFGGKHADANLHGALRLWPLAMIVSLAIVGLVAHQPWAFLAAAFVFGIASFANVPAMQMRVMKHGGAAPELAATANISAFNLANALGGIIGGAVIDSHYGAAMIPYAAAVVPLLGVLLILLHERREPAAALASADPQARAAAECS